jgi:prophage regulatory protein
MSSPLHLDELILRHERKRLVPLSDTTIWRMERRGEFPRRIVISTKRVAWRRREIEVWLARRERRGHRNAVPG